MAEQNFVLRGQEIIVARAAVSSVVQVGRKLGKDNPENQLEFACFTAALELYQRLAAANNDPLF